MTYTNNNIIFALYKVQMNLKFFMDMRISVIELMFNNNIKQVRIA